MKDPAAWYALVYVSLRQAFAEHGYAVAIHGTLQRDFDIVAVPWTEEAVSAADLVAVVVDACMGLACSVDGPTVKPHGRRSYAIVLFNGGYIDLSVMPRTEAQP